MPTEPPPRDEGDSSRGAPLSRQQLVDLTGAEITAKTEFVLSGDRLWHREVDGFREYLPAAGP